MTNYNSRKLFTNNADNFWISLGIKYLSFKLQCLNNSYFIEILNLLYDSTWPNTDVVFEYVVQFHRCVLN